MYERSKEMGKLGARRRTLACLRPLFGLSRTSRRRSESYRATGRDKELIVLLSVRIVQIVLS